MKWISVVAEESKYPLVAEEPANFYQITRFFRTSDRLIWAGLTFGVPGFLYGLGKVEQQNAFFLVSPPLIKTFNYNG